MTRAKVIDCEIGGHRYHLKIDGEPEKAQKVIAYVNDKIHSLKEKNKDLNKNDVWVLISLVLAEEILSFKKKANVQLDILESEARRISSELKKSQMDLNDLNSN